MSEDALVDEALAVTHQPLDHLRVFDIEAHAAPAVKDRGRDAATAAARGGTTGTTATKEAKGSSDNQGSTNTEKTGSSELYKQCKTREEAKTEAEKKAEATKAGEKENTGSSSATGTCIQELIDNPDTKGGILALLIGVPVALVALLGVAAAASGMIPGVQLPALPF